MSDLTTGTKLGLGGLLALGILLTPMLALSWQSSAAQRLQEEEAVVSPDEIPVASEANAAYCTPPLRQVLRRVLTSCGLVGGTGGRGCQPADARTVATMSGEDFNALFSPMRERGAILQFPLDSSELDDTARNLLTQVFLDRRGGGWFLIVARASPEGSVEHNRELSHSRAQSVMSALAGVAEESVLSDTVGMLWLSEEFAQLDPTFCEWRRNGGGACRPEDLNRSAFVAWIDCRL